MKKNYLHRLSILFIFSATLAIFSSLQAQSIVAQHGRLRVEGNQVVDKSGAPISLAGNSLFWSNAGDVADFYNATTVNHLADAWNSSIIRAAMGVNESWDGGTGYIGSPQQQEAKIRKVIDAAINRGIYVIIDWHTHEAEEYQPEAVEFFGKMARIYGDNPHVIYEIYNEPINQSWSTIKSYAEAVTAAIRAEDPDNLIIVGTPFYSQRVDVASDNPLNDNNTAYTLHFYAGTHRQGLRDQAIQAMNNGIALFVTEWGAVNASGDGAADKAETERWMDFLQEKKISHANWSVADKDEGASVVQPGKGVQGLTSDQLTATGSFVKDIIENWSGSSDGGGGNPAPRVSFASPSGDLTVVEGYTLDIEVTATDSDGSIAQVALFIDNQLVRIERRIPYTWGHSGSPNPDEVNGLSAGTYTMKAVATDNEGATAEASFTLTVQSTDSGGGSGAACEFGTPVSMGLPTLDNMRYDNVYVLGEGEPSLNNIRRLTISWVAPQNGLYQFAFTTNNGQPAWYANFSNDADYQFQNAQPEITLSNTGFPGLDGSYWVTTDGNNLVMVSKAGGFTLYFSNSDTAPNCGDNARYASQHSKSIGDHLQSTSSADDLSVRVYPNPATNILQIDRLPASSYQLSVYTIDGKEVISRDDLAEKTQLTLPIHELPAGVYFVKILADEPLSPIKFVKE